MLKDRQRLEADLFVGASFRSILRASWRTPSAAQTVRLANDRAKAITSERERKGRAIPRAAALEVKLLASAFAPAQISSDSAPSAFSGESVLGVEQRSNRLHPGHL